MSAHADFSSRSWKAPINFTHAQPIIIMKSGMVAFLAAGVGFTAIAQSFYNLDFEQASLIPHYGDPYGRVQFGPALPGWTGYCGTDVQTVANYNFEFLDSPGISILDSTYTNLPISGLIHGRYCVLLQTGEYFMSSFVATAIAQTGTVPADARSIIFNAGLISSITNLAVTFNGAAIPLVVLTAQPNYVVLGGDVSQFAGQSGELRFTAPILWNGSPPQPYWKDQLLDDIRFSSQPSPPSAPMIGTSPQSQTVDVGTTVDFAVTAGGSAPLTYQWFFNQTNTLQGATNSTLELVNVQPGQAGTYMVAVSNSFGTVASAPATLIVNASPPLIVTPPLSRTTTVGASIDFTVSATGSLPLSYQWFFNGSNILGATSTDLVFPSLETSQSGTYTVVVTNAFGAVTSAPATLIVYANPPSILTPPLSQTNNVGASIDFTVSANGSLPLSYQWCFNNNAISGAGGTLLHLANLQPSQAGAYTVVVTNAFGAITSSPALLTVIAIPPNIVTSPHAQTAIVGWSVDLTVSASGSPLLSYQWLFNASAISGASDDDLRLTNLQISQSGTYTVIVTNAFGAVTSAPAVLTVIARPPNPPAGTVVGWGDLAIPYVAPGTRFTTIAAGSLHSLAIKSDGTVVAWGNDSGGQSAVPAGLSNVIAIAGGGYGLPSHSLALKSDGTIVAWGNNYNGGQGTVPLGLSGVIGVAAGSQHNLALKSDGTVFAWGDYTRGQTNIPVGLGGVVAIAAGGYHNLALKSDGTVVAWGDNGWGQTNIPAGLNGVIAVAAAYLHSLALKSDGTVVAWGGANSSGEISVPAGLKGVTAIAAKGYHSLALKSDGTVVAWGDNSSGQSAVPAGLSNVIAIAAGEEHSLALKSDDRTIVAWGASDYGQTMVPGILRGITGLASGGWMGGHDLALKDDGTVLAWGRIACQFSSWVPANLSGVVALAAGECHGLALKSDGTVIAWGDNWAGQTNVPGGLSNVLAIAAGGYHSLAVRSDGTVVAWGSDGDQSGNFAGQSTVPPGLINATAVAGGEYHSLALKSDGTVAAWGSNKDYSGGYAGQSVVPADLGGVVAIAAGGFHSLALKSNGTVVAWGNDSFGQSDVPGGLNAVVGIAAGQYHSLALKSDGTVVAWGDNQSSECTVPVDLPRAIGVFAGGLRGLALVAVTPILLTPPDSQTAEIGSTVGFHVHATGIMPLSYEWFFNSTIATTGSTTNCALLLTNVQPSEAGAYTVVVTNIAGAVTSAPAMLNVIPVVERRMVPALTMTGQPGSSLSLEGADALGPSPNWATLGNVALTNICQWYFDLSTPLPPQRFYRAWQSGTSSVPPALDFHLVPALTLTGTVGSAVRVDYINQFGPTDAWVTLATVILTNTSQLYFDVSTIGQPPRLWRLITVP
jgi:alpha-tubulin suppressor-like RCC1 family protein